MIKSVSLLTRKAGMTHEQFVKQKTFTVEEKVIVPSPSA